MISSESSLNTDSERYPRSFYITSTGIVILKKNLRQWQETFSTTELRPQPSAIFVGIEEEALRICKVRLKWKRLGDLINPQSKLMASLSKFKLLIISHSRDVR
jgi:hypothetical protein